MGLWVLPFYQAWLLNILPPLCIKPMKKCITMRSLGSNGRFGNQIFQYAFMRFYARMHGLLYQVPCWEGQEIFGLDDPPISVDLPVVKVRSKAELDCACAKMPLFGIDFWGYFQETAYFLHDKNFFYDLFQPNPELDRYLNGCWASLQGHEVIGLHLRYGDYGYAYFFETPIRWVIDELERRWRTFSSPILYLATDDQRACKALKKFSPVLCADIFPTSERERCPTFYADFWALSKENSLLIIANSSFSFAAAMLNHNCQKMLRPSLASQGLIPFDPWDSPVLLRQTNGWLNFVAKHPTFLRHYNNLRRHFLFNWNCH